MGAADGADSKKGRALDTGPAKIPRVTFIGSNGEGGTVPFGHFTETAIPIFNCSSEPDYEDFDSAFSFASRSDTTGLSPFASSMSCL